MQTSSVPMDMPIDRSRYAASDALSHRQTASALRLIADAAGGPRDWARKLVRLAGTVSTALNGRYVAAGSTSDDPLVLLANGA